MIKLDEKIDKYLIGEAKGVYIRKVNPFSTYTKREKFEKLFNIELEKNGLKSNGGGYNKMFYGYDLKFKYKGSIIPIRLQFAMKDIEESGTIYFKVYGNIGKFPEGVLWPDWNGWGRIYSNDKGETTPEYYVEKILKYLNSEENENGNPNLKIRITDSLNSMTRGLPDKDIDKFFEYMMSGRFMADANEKIYGIGDL